MKLKLLPILLLSCCLSAPSLLQAQILFNENFDGSPYRNNTSFDDPPFPVVGVNQLQYGYWGVNNSPTGVVAASTNRSLSSNRSMSMTGGANANAQFLAIFGVNGTAASPTHSALDINFAFNLTNAQSTFEFVVRDLDGINIAIVSIGGTQANVRGLFSNGSQTTGSLSANTWYNLQLGLTANPGTGADKFSVSLFDASGSSQIGTTLTGDFYSPSNKTGYSYMTGIFNAGALGTDAVYIDNISAQAVPEASTVGCLLLGGVAGGIMLLRRRFLQAK